MNKEFFPSETLDIIKRVRRLFSKCMRLWSVYVSSGKAGDNTDLAQEAAKRLKQAKYLFDRVVSLEDQSRKSVPAMFMEIRSRPDGVPQKALRKDSKIAFKTELYTESAYYHSARLVDLVHFITKDKRVKRSSKGITMVRNNLIEHSQTSKEKVTSISFGHVGPYGPQVKPARPSHQVNTYHDPGLYKNLEEMLVAIHFCLSSK